MVTLNINGRSHQVDVEPNTPLLWAIREQVGLTGTKYGCGIAQCGACTVLVDGQAMRSCVTPVSAVGAMKVTTIEGLGGTHPVQKAWVQHDVPQCGYCQSGQIMGAVALLATTPKPDEAAISGAMDGHICRCGAYQRIRAAIKTAAAMPAVAVTAPALAVPKV